LLVIGSLLWNTDLLVEAALVEKRDPQCKKKARAAVVVACKMKGGIKSAWGNKLRFLRGLSGPATRT